MAVVKSFVSVVWYGFSVAAQVVILIALVFLIGEFSKKTIIFPKFCLRFSCWLHTPHCTCTFPTRPISFFLPVTLASAKTILRQENMNMEDYEYYQVPAYGHGGYDASGGGSSYASGYSKRSADFPSFLNMPVVQKLTERVHQAIEAYSAQN